MKTEEILQHLGDLKSEAEGHYTDDGDDEVFHLDAEALAVAIDAVKSSAKIIHCKDCIYRDFLDSDYGGYCCTLNRIEIYLDDYCSRGKKMSELLGKAAKDIAADAAQGGLAPATSLWEGDAY